MTAWTLVFVAAALVGLSNGARRFLNFSVGVTSYTSTATSYNTVAYFLFS